MTDIPEEITEIARRIAQTGFLDAEQHAELAEIIAQALLSERRKQIERDAKIAERASGDWDGEVAAPACLSVAAAIRAQQEPS